jgi:hypothetical protein
VLSLAVLRSGELVNVLWLVNLGIFLPSSHTF